jgi:beta-glucanase (GH16 family)
MSKNIFGLTAFLCLISWLSGCHEHPNHVSPPRASYPGWALIWSDEFSGPEGSLPDPGKWTYDMGGNGWGNHELESYTNRKENAHVEGGNLVITARKETLTDKDGVTRGYTSARLKTQGIFQQTYGRVEARIKITGGQGMWPAFWMLGGDIATVGWPKCGEIDIMENIGKEPGMNHGSLHGPSTAAATSDLTAVFSLPEGKKLAEDFHIYAAEWEPDTVRFYVDKNLYATFHSSELPAGGKWVYDHPFFLLLNVAVGGDWPGAPDANTAFPQRMLVDYVRVYSKN